mgnify:CR=1 FL=1
MKKTINRKTYNTETATAIAGRSASLPRSDFGHWEATLYRTAKGAYFLHGKGGATSEYADHIGHLRRGGSDIIPKTGAEALAWCEEHECQDAIDTHFAALIEDA